MIRKTLAAVAATIALTGGIGLAAAGPAAAATARPAGSVRYCDYFVIVKSAIVRPRASGTGDNGKVYYGDTWQAYPKTYNGYLLGVLVNDTKIHGYVNANYLELYSCTYN